MLIYRLRDIFHINWFLDDFIRIILFSKFNKKIKQFTEMISEIDPIQNPRKFVDFKSKIPPIPFGTSYAYKRVYGENCFYGYAHQLMKYAGISSRQIIFFPLMEHGIIYDDFNPADFNNLNSSYIFQGRYHQKEWNTLRNKKQDYYVGPYIYYSKGIYDDKTLISMKQKLGKTLLIFVTHSSEYRNMTSNTLQILKNYINESGEKYDSILACVYWIDLTKELIDLMEENNIKVVSCGFKNDNNFVCRLKSILSLSDTVLYPYFSSSIGYAFLLKKHIVCVYNENDNDNSNAPAGEIKKNIEFLNYFSLNTSKTYDEQYSYINKYWGLSEIKTPEQIKEIFIKNKKNLIRHLGF